MGAPRSKRCRRGSGFANEWRGVMEINCGDLYWVVKMILKAVGALVRLREGDRWVGGYKTRNQVVGLDFARAVENGTQRRLPKLVGCRGPDGWVAGGAHSMVACRMVGGAHLGTCTSPLFPHSLFTSSLTQTFHPLLLRTINRPGRSPVCSRLVVVDVEASARTCLDC